MSRTLRLVPIIWWYSMMPLGILANSYICALDDNKFERGRGQTWQSVGLLALYVRWMRPEAMHIATNIPHHVRAL